MGLFSWLKRRAEDREAMERAARRAAYEAAAPFASYETMSGTTRDLDEDGVAKLLSPHHAAIADWTPQVSAIAAAAADAVASGKPNSAAIKDGEALERKITARLDKYDLTSMVTINRRKGDSNVLWVPVREMRALLDTLQRAVDDLHDVSDSSTS